MSASLALRREVAVDELMQCRGELAAISIKTLELVGEIDEGISSNLRRIGVAEPEAIVVELEALAEKVGGALSEGF